MFEAILKRRYGEVEGDRIIHVLKIYSAGAHTRYHSRTGEKYYQRRAPYPATIVGFSLRQIMSLARKIARMKNNGETQLHRKS